MNALMPLRRVLLALSLLTGTAQAADWVTAADGAVHDPSRIDFMTRYLRSLHRAIVEGVPAIGYLHWTFMDNFEWAEGYKERFGLTYVDYPTQKRTLKDSAHWYATVIASNGELLLERAR